VSEPEPEQSATAPVGGSIESRAAAFPEVERTTSSSGHWIELDAPSEGELLRSAVGLLEISGRVGRGERGVHDVVIALDGSQSSLLPSGIDLDGDGVVGDLRFPGRGRDGTRGPFLRWTTDFGDVVVQGEIAAARNILRTLDPERARVGVIRYSGSSSVIAPMGKVADAARALDQWSHRADWTGSSIASGVIGGLNLLDDLPADETGAGRRRAVLLIASDGLATAALSGRTGAMARSPRIEEKLAAREALRAAERARKAGVWIYAFEVINGEDEDPGLLASMAETTDGRYVYVDDPNQLRFELPNPDYVELRGVQVENLTLDDEARAVRVFSNGEFDGFVSLAEGRNRLRVRAELPSGERLELERSVEYVRPERPYPSDTKRVESLRDSLRRRTEETLALPPKRSEPQQPRRRAVRVQVPNEPIAEPPAEQP